MWRSNGKSITTYKGINEVKNIFSRGYNVRYDKVAIAGNSVRGYVGKFMNIFDGGQRWTKMKYLIKILKYLACVGIAMIGFMSWLLVFAEKSGFATPHGEVDIPIYLGIGWIIYQVAVNKIHEQRLNYYSMIVKVTLQTSVIILSSLAIMLKLFG